MTLLAARELAIPGRLHATGIDVQSGELVALVVPNGCG